MKCSAQHGQEKQVRVLVVSSIVPDGNDFAGPLVLHRYLNLNPQVKTEILKWSKFPLRLKIIGKFRQLGFAWLSHFLEGLMPVRPSQKMVAEKIRAFNPDVLLTVAHGSWHVAAAAAARAHNLPLVTFFQDWWPEFPHVQPWFRARVEQQIMRTRDASSVCICVSQGMLQMLGNPPQATLIYDMPSRIQAGEWQPRQEGPLRVAYYGNLGEYGPPLERALLALQDSTLARLEIYGVKPRWSPGIEEQFRKSGHYHGRLAPEELLKALTQYQAALVCMSFDPAMKHRMMSSFPSKLIEGMQLGLPVIVWGPEYCSAVQWARQESRAVCVTDPNPTALRQALEQLAESVKEQQRLAAASRQAAQTDFNPDRIQQQFMNALSGVAIGLNQPKPGMKSTKEPVCLAP